MEVLAKAEQWMARALSESSYVTGEAYGVVKELTSELTSAKEEIERLTETANSVGKLHVELSKMNHALTAERKETERLVAEALHKGRMEALNEVFQINGPSRAIARLRKKYEAALHPQQEAQ